MDLGYIGREMIKVGGRWWILVFARDPTVVWVLEDRHGHHDCRRRRVEGAGGSGLLQRRDGAAVLRRDVGVRTGTHRTHHALQGLSYKEREGFNFSTLISLFTTIKFLFFTS